MRERSGGELKVEIRTEDSEDSVSPKSAKKKKSRNEEPLNVTSETLPDLSGNSQESLKLKDKCCTGKNSMIVSITYIVGFRVIDIFLFMKSLF